MFPFFLDFLVKVNFWMNSIFAGSMVVLGYGGISHEMSTTDVEYFEVEEYLKENKGVKTKMMKHLWTKKGKQATTQALKKRSRL